MLRCSVAFIVGVVVTALAVWLSSASAPAGAAEPTGYTLKDVYDFIVSNGGTNPVAGGHSLYPTDAPGTGGMPAISQIMEELRKKLPVQPGGVLPATGQTTCYDTAGSVIDCASADWPGQDGFYQKGCPTTGRFADNGDGTVTDNCTGLMWQKENAPDTYTWQNALKYCESLTLAGHDDWRLPNVRELQSIVDIRRYSPSIDPVFGAEIGWYWSSSTRVYSPGDAWYVDFDGGYVGDAVDKDVPSYVRAVRG